MGFISYSDTDIFINRNDDDTIKSRRYETVLYPKIPLSADDIYIVTKVNDRLDLVAHEYYGDQRFWKVIARANNLGKGTMVIPEGTELRIPQNPDELESLFIKYNSER